LPTVASTANPRFSVDDDLQMQLAHPMDDDLPGLDVGIDPERRISAISFCRPTPSFSWSVLFRLDGERG